MVESAEDLQPWREAVKYSALNYRSMHSRNPVRVVCTFIFERPKNHYGTGRNALNLKPSAPFSMVTKPDVDKLARAVLDALTGVLFYDDSQVISLTVTKKYRLKDEMLGVWIEVESL